MNLNARSILPKSTEFAGIATAYYPHVICVTETWLHDSVLDCEFTPPNYIVVRCDRSCGRGGGVALFFRSDVSRSIG